MSDTLTQAEFDVMITDPDKTIDGDLDWSHDTDHSSAVEFRAKIRSGAGYQLFINGRYNPFAETLSFTLVFQGRRVYALDLGAEHTNPDRTRVGTKHKHRWRTGLRDKWAYVPEDITAPWTKPIDVWKQFCAEAAIVHNGKLNPPQDGLIA